MAGALCDGRALSFEEATGTFLDATGRPGPSTWELGTYLAGSDDFPVTGVSWYEAAAFAEFMGHSLPTAYHWYWVAGQDFIGNVIRLANFNSAGPVPAGETRALHRFGAYGLAGNAKEWCVNQAPDGRRYTLGGGWDEPPYLFRDVDARSAFDRGRNLGFRTVKYDQGDTSVASVSGRLLPPSRNYATEKPVSDEVFQAYGRVFSYDATDLAVKIESVDDTNPDWHLEKISVAAAYGQERVIVYLFQPKQGHPPYQTIVFIPDSSAWFERTSPDVLDPPFAFLVRSGRAVAFPIYKGSYERANTEYNGGDQFKSSSIWRDYLIFFSKDLRRTVDHLVTRSDIDSQKLGFLGFSRGAALSPIMLTQEPRLKAAALWIPGFYPEKEPSEVDPINFAPRVTRATICRATSPIARRSTGSTDSSAP